MADDIDFWAVAEGLQATLKAGLTARGLGYKDVLVEPDGVQLGIHNTPLIAIMLGEGLTQPRAGQSAYETFELTVEIACVDLSNFATAAKQRIELFRACRGIVRANPRFHVEVNEARLAGYEFERAVDTADTTWYAAIARFQIVIGAYYDQ